MTEQRKDGGAEDIAAERQAQADAFHEANSNCFTEFESFDSGWKAGVAYVRAASSAAPDGGKGKAGCSMGVGCDEAGVCYAMAHGQPERCAAPQAEHMDGGKGEAVIGRPDWLRIFGTHFEVNSTPPRKSSSLRVQTLKRIQRVWNG
jgi:hypothetical protein